MAAVAIASVPRMSAPQETLVAGVSISEFKAAEQQVLRFDSGGDVLVVVPLRHRCRVEISWNDQAACGAARAGQVFVVPPSTSTAWKWDGRHEVLCARVVGPGLRFGPVLAGEEKPAIAPARFRHDPVLANLCESLWQETQARDVGSDVSCEALARLLRVHLVRKYGTQESGVTRGGLPPHRLKASLAFIEENLARPILLSAVADAAGLSPQHFCRMFKVSVGVTPHRYITEQRVEKAKEMLREPRLSLVEIALETGFPSQSHFGCTFRKVTGTTPGRFRSGA